MKKIIIGFLTICCVLTMQAAPMGVKVLRCTDAEKIKSELPSIKEGSFIRFYYQFQLMYLANPKIIDNFESLKDAAEAANVKAKYNKGKYQATQLIAFVAPKAHKYRKQAYDLNPKSQIALQYLLSKLYNAETTEGWNYIANEIICDSNNHVNPAEVVRVLIKNDLNIPKDKKIEVYSKLYEKWYIELAGKNKDRYTAPVTMVAMKLKSLGYDVNK